MSQRTTVTDGYQFKSEIPHLPVALSDHPSLVGIIRIPFCNNFEEETTINAPIYKDEKWQMVEQKVKLSTEISQVKFESVNFDIPKNTITDFYPYTYYVLTDGECEPLTMLPQYMPNSCSVKGKYAISHQPVERFYVEGYKGDNSGNVYNITNLNQMMLPTATNEGTNFLSANANTIMQNRKSQVTNNILSAVGGVASTVGTGLINPLAGIGVGLGAMSNSINGLNEIKNSDARNQDQMLTPNSISSFGTPSTRIAFDNNNVRVLKYEVKQNVKNKVNNFVKRYGNKYNNYANINLKTYKGYLKMISPNVDGSVDNEYINKIIEVLERGVYIE